MRKEVLMEDTDIKKKEEKKSEKFDKEIQKDLMRSESEGFSVMYK